MVQFGGNFSRHFIVASNTIQRLKVGQVCGHSVCSLPTCIADGSQNIYDFYWQQKAKTTR